MTKRFQPYSPMGPPPKNVSQQDMLAILEKRTSGQPIRKPAQSPPLEPIHPGKLLWRPPVLSEDKKTGYQETICKRFTVEKSLVEGVPVYCGWKRLNEWRFVLGSGKTADEAKALCQKESDRPTLIKAQEICST